jgi:hypothetical protein
MSSCLRSELVHALTRDEACLARHNFYLSLLPHDGRHSPENSTIGNHYAKNTCAVAGSARAQPSRFLIFEHRMSARPIGGLVI